MARRSKLSTESLMRVREIQEVIERFSNYWPLTLRQVYYQLVAALLIDNNVNEYKKLSNLLTRARLQELVPWEAIEDRTRERLSSGGWDNMYDFIEGQSELYLDGYKRDLMQNQDVKVELWIEKDALSRVCHDKAFDYCVPVVVAKGYSSISFMHECRNRIEQSLRDDGKPTMILYFGDLDPSGWDMPNAMMKTFTEDMGLTEDEIQIVRCALQPEHVEDMNLPHNPDALKFTDSRAKAYIEKFGEIAVELDAVPPDVLQRMVEASIQSVVDLDQINEEVKRQTIEREAIKQVKDVHGTWVTQVIDDIKDQLGDDK